MENQQNGFDRFNLSAPIMETLKSLEFVTPTEIQERTIPLILEGRDILGSAQTGSGKTAAFGLPIIEILSKDLDATALVITPTRELAEQVYKVLYRLTKGLRGMRCVSLIGGQSMYTQLQQLKGRSPNIVVGTPGRINDHLKRHTLHLDKAKFLVLDETDRMLDMGFGIQVDEILKSFPATRQTLMFSATFSQKILKLAKTYLTNPEHIQAGPKNTVAESITQESKFVSNKERFDTLTTALMDRSGAFLVFAKTQRNVEALEEQLKKQNIDALSIHGGYSQRKRDNVIRMFRGQQSRILIATDVAARGLDITHIENVVNYDLPLNPEDYIHRIGRTGRANAKGYALSLVTPETRKLWSNIAFFLSGDEERIVSVPFKGGDRSRPNSGKKRFEGRRSEGRSFERRPSGDRPFKRKVSDAFASDALSEIVTAEPRQERQSEGRRSEGRRSEGRPSGDRPFKRKVSDAFASDALSEIVTAEPRQERQSERRSERPAKPRFGDRFAKKDFSRSKVTSDRAFKHKSRSNEETAFVEPLAAVPSKKRFQEKFTKDASKRSNGKPKRTFEQSKSKVKREGATPDTSFCLNGLLDECYAQRVSKKTQKRTPKKPVQKFSKSKKR